MGIKKPILVAQWPGASLNGFGQGAGDHGLRHAEI
jgi:hypothetical protein